MSEVLIHKVEELPSWFEEVAQKLSPTVLWQANRIYHQNLRQCSASTKTRGMVNATGKKPYRQKKTGRARRGSFVAPLHRGGGVAHGPLPVKKRLKLPRKMSQAALLLSAYEKYKAGNLYLFDASALQSGLTKHAFDLFLGAGFEKETICCPLLKEEGGAYRALRNLQFVYPAQSENLTSWQVLPRQCLLFSSDSWNYFLNERFKVLRGAQ